MRRWGKRLTVFFFLLGLVEVAVVGYSGVLENVLFLVGVGLWIAGEVQERRAV